MTQQEPWYRKTAVIIAALIFLAPVGIALLWMSGKFSKKIPELGQTWSRYRVRPGTVADAKVVAAWTGHPTHQQSLDSAATHLRDNDGKCFVIERVSEEVIGVLTLHECYLNFAFLQKDRGQGVGRRAAAVLVEEFFRDGSESFLAAGTPISPDGEHLISALGFDENLRLKRSVWNKKARKLSSLF